MCLGRHTALGVEARHDDRLLKRHAVSLRRPELHLAVEVEVAAVLAEQGHQPAAHVRSDVRHVGGLGRRAGGGTQLGRALPQAEVEARHVGAHEVLDEEARLRRLRGLGHSHPRDARPLARAHRRLDLEGLAHEEDWVYASMPSRLAIQRWPLVNFSTFASMLALYSASSLLKPSESATGAGPGFSAAPSFSPLSADEDAIDRALTTQRT